MDKLIGTWRLVDWVTVTDEGEIAHPMGPGAQGVICYTDEGLVHVHLMAANRDLHAADDTQAGSPEEDSRSAKTHLSYSGRWHLEGEGKVVHTLDFCSFPNWVGSRQERLFKFDGAEINLSTPPMPWGNTNVFHRLRWKRAA